VQFSEEEVVPQLFAGFRLRLFVKGGSIKVGMIRGDLVALKLKDGSSLD
jgi:hypothetical protein